MAHSKFFLICGNCGNDFLWEWKFNPKFDDNGDGSFSADVLLFCKNCGTLHSLNDKAKEI